MRIINLEIPLKHLKQSLSLRPYVAWKRCQDWTGRCRWRFPCPID